MWEPFSEPARRAVVRSQEVAQMFGAHYIGTEHMIFALAEGDDPVGEALANAVDRDAMRAQLGSVSQAPIREMVFTPGAKQAIELAFEHARRFHHGYIGTGHLALGILGSTEPPPLLAGHDVASLRAALEAATSHDAPASEAAHTWTQLGAESVHPLADAVASTLRSFRTVAKDGTRVSVTVAVPGEAERTWSWVKDPQP